MNQDKIPIQNSSLYLKILQTFSQKNHSKLKTTKKESNQLILASDNKCEFGVLFLSVNPS